MIASSKYQLNDMYRRRRVPIKSVLDKRVYLWHARLASSFYDIELDPTTSYSCHEMLWLLLHPRADLRVERNAVD